MENLRKLQTENLCFSSKAWFPFHFQRLYSYLFSCYTFLAGMLALSLCTYRIGGFGEWMFGRKELSEAFLDSSGIFKCWMSEQSSAFGPNMFEVSIEFNFSSYLQIYYTKNYTRQQSRKIRFYMLEMKEMLFILFQRMFSFSKLIFYQDDMAKWRNVNENAYNDEKVLY